MADYYLIYDNQCPLCVGVTDLMRGLDPLTLVKPVPLALVRESVELSAVRLPLDGEMQKAIHLICSDGRVWVGADAVAKLASLHPRSRLLGRFMALPGVRRVTHLVYELVARHRHSLFRTRRRPTKTAPSGGRHDDAAT